MTNRGPIEGFVNNIAKKVFGVANERWASAKTLQETADGISRMRNDPNAGERWLKFVRGSNSLDR